MKKILLGITFLFAIFCVFTFNAQASTIYGYTSFSGSFDSDTQDLRTATYFNNFSNVVVSTTGGLNDYSAVPGNQAVTINDKFTFVPDVDTKISDFWSIVYGGTTYSYDFLTSEVEFASENSIAIKGTGIAHISGFDDTDSVWYLSATGAGALSSFTLSTLVPSDYQMPSAVPEPASMLLLGMGLLGFAGLRRKKN